MFQVTKRVAAYVAQSKEYFESTDLAMRVRSWHERIAPKLEAIEKRGDFDIHNYGTNIIRQFGAGDEGAAKARKTSYNFKELVVGKPREEACRVFLSMLMLANTNNIDVKPIKSDPNERMPMDNVELTLLSRNRHQDRLADFQAPSQRSPAAASPASSLKSRKKRDDRVDSRNGDLSLSPTLDPIREEDDDPAVANGAAAAVNGSALAEDRVEPESSREGSEDFEFRAPIANPTSKKSCKRKMKF